MSATALLPLSVFIPIRRLGVSKVNAYMSSWVLRAAREIMGSRLMRLLGMAMLFFIDPHDVSCFLVLAVYVRVFHV